LLVGFAEIGSSSRFFSLYIHRSFELDSTGVTVSRSESMLSIRRAVPSLSTNLTYDWFSAHRLFLLTPNLPNPYRPFT